jgi:hypothetical protein
LRGSTVRRGYRADSFCGVKAASRLGQEAVPKMGKHHALRMIAPAIWLRHTRIMSFAPYLRNSS